MKRSIIDQCEIRRFRRNSVLYRIGDPVDGMHAALEGDFRAYVQGDDNERILLRLIGPQSWFGEFHLLDNYPTRSFEIQTASSSTALFLSKASYDSIADEQPDNFRHFVRLHCVHTRFLVRIAVEARSSAPRRTARALLRIAKMHGRPVEHGIELSVTISQSELASVVGVSRQYMNELVSAWNEQGLLVWKGNGSGIRLLPELRKLLTPVDDWMAESEGWA